MHGEAREHLRWTEGAGRAGGREAREASSSLLFLLPEILTKVRRKVS
jgi:hypothetical protein